MKKITWRRTGVFISQNYYTAQTEGDNVVVAKITEVKKTGACEAKYKLGDDWLVYQRPTIEAAKATIEKVHAARSKFYVGLKGERT